MSVQAPAETSTAIEAEGWTRRFTALGLRLGEAVELYRELGYEVRLDPADAGEETGRISDEACAQCLVMTLARTIYTRRPTAAGSARTEEMADKRPRKGDREATI
jgi:hypothetical protein